VTSDNFPAELRPEKFPERTVLAASMVPDQFVLNTK
jgi:hypothetical protein